MLEYLRRLVLQRMDNLAVADTPEMMKAFEKDEVVLFSLQAVKVNQRNWKQTRSIVITNKGMYNFNGKVSRRFVDSTKIRGCIYSSKSYELIIHIPTEFDYHYIVSEHMEKLIYYIYVCKQLNSIEPVELVLVKTDVEFLAQYAVKEKQKSEDEFKRIEGITHQKEIYKSKIKFELFTESFIKYFRHFAELYCEWLEPVDPQKKAEFSITNLVPIAVLSAGKCGRIVLVQNKISKNKMVAKAMYRWKLVNFSDDEKLLKVLFKFRRFNQWDNIVNYYCCIDSSSIVMIYMKFYVGGSLLFHMRRMKGMGEELSRKIISQLVKALDNLHASKLVVLSKHV